MYWGEQLPGRMSTPLKVWYRLLCINLCTGIPVSFIVICALQRPAPSVDILRPTLCRCRLDLLMNQ